MFVVAVVAVDVPALAAPLADRTEGEFPEPADFAQHYRTFGAGESVDGLAIRGYSQLFAVLHGLFQVAAPLRPGNGAFGLEQRPFAIADPIEVFLEQPDFFGARQGERAIGPIGDQRSDGNFYLFFPLVEHLPDEHQGR